MPSSLQITSSTLLAESIRVLSAYQNHLIYNNYHRYHGYHSYHANHRDQSSPNYQLIITNYQLPRLTTMTKPTIPTKMSNESYESGRSIESMGLARSGEKEQYGELSFYTLGHPDAAFIHQNIVDAYAAPQISQ